MPNRVLLCFFVSTKEKTDRKQRLTYNSRIKKTTSLKRQYFPFALLVTTSRTLVKHETDAS